MKKKLFISFMACLSFLGASKSASAVSLFYTERYNPVDIFLSADGPVTTKRWVFNLTDNPEWDTPDQVFKNGKIVLNLADDAGAGDGGENGFLKIDGARKSLKKISSTDPYSLVWRKNFVVDFNAFTDGKIVVVLKATKGDFWFRNAALTVESWVPDITPPTEDEHVDAGQYPRVGAVPIPEPTSMFLFGTGLLGLVAVGKKRRS